VPAYRGLRRAHPDAQLTLAAPATLRPLVELGCGVDRVLPVEGLGRLRWPYAPPELAVNLHGKGPQSIEDLLGTGAARLLTYSHPAQPSIAGPEWSTDEHEVARWCRLLAWGGVPADPGDLLLRRPDRPAAVADAVVVHPGSSAASRRWPGERFAEVARALASDGQRVVVTGSASERELAERVARSSAQVLAGSLDLGGLAALVAGARLVVCGDTGVGHLASAFATPSVLVFGPTPPEHWGPPADGPHRVVWSGQTGDPEAACPDPGLLRVSAGEVIAACRQQLAETGSDAIARTETVDQRESVLVPEIPRR
jgi:ADP-heptose:LPS heptosyltransferase